ncbi:30S ribosomal protein S14 [Candidatus Nasuia deltocephalinicola]|uniref:30S ribosomal protein S14 n=1 Tax=Candidatus Nasuia deltocephalincola TaxID=1160784 RepID=UPI00216AC524|nr:30S ribosomal protein S14 [Candidatus Nasuia deltocephalinicola]
MFYKNYLKYKCLKDKLNTYNNIKKRVFGYFNSTLDFQKIPRNSNPTRIRNRCYITGRPRGVFRRFGLSRCMIKDLAFKGFIPGLFKSSW